MASSSPPKGSPPAYIAEDEAVAGLAKGTQSLKISSSIEPTNFPTPEEVLIHLKLLHAIYNLRTSVANTDGLFELYDIDVTKALAKKATGAGKKQLKVTLLSKLKEKRWAVFVTRASKRFESWWMALKRKHGEKQLTEEDLKDPNLRTKLYPSASKLMSSRESLPPLDILMVWHSFMLNPRCYLEDCLRQGMMPLWRDGMPWVAINASIDIETETYNPGDEARAQFESLTNTMKWSSFDDPDECEIFCPRCDCAKPMSVDWTNVSRARVFAWAEASLGAKVQDFPTGSGYADSGLTTQCPRCRGKINHDQLRAKKFRDDCYKTRTPRMYMPGTILDKNGTVEHPLETMDSRSFPNDLLDAIMEETRGFPSDMLSISAICQEIEKALKTKDTVKKANHGVIQRIPQDARINVRRMMSRYWQNSSPFALDLIGAVIRQGSFIEKMEHIDWLNSPAVSSTASRLIDKYARFFHIMTLNPKSTVPTLDVDLAWHTHQLTPASYYAYSCKKTSATSCKFFDHDDKISETRLHSGFIATSKLYQSLYKEPYSECLCWYCEAVRATHDTRFSGLVPGSSVKSAQKALTFRDKSQPFPSDPETGPHISVHNAIAPKTPLFRIGERKYERERAKTMSELVFCYDKACKRAKRAGRPVPARPAFLDRDDGPYDRSAAVESSLLFYPVVPIGIPFYGVPCDDSMYAGSPSCANFCPGGIGNCAKGVCGGGVAAGACTGGACAGVSADGGAGVDGGCASGGGCSGGDGGGDGGCSGCGGCGGCGG